MYKMMTNKIKFYSDNENNIFNSVKSTIFKAYDKTQESNQKFNIQISELKDKIIELQKSLSKKEEEIASQKILFEDKISKLNEQNSIKEMELEKLKSYDQVTQNNYNNCDSKIKKITEELNEEKSKKLKMEVKLKNEIDKCSAKIMESNKELSDFSNTLKENIHKCVNEKTKLLENQILCNKKLNDELSKVEKLNSNLNLIDKKITKLHFKSKNSSYIEDEDSDYNPFFNQAENLKNNELENNRFMEVQKFQSETKLETRFNELTKKGNEIKNRLDSSIFKNIAKSKEIYEFIEKLENTIIVNKNSKRNCDLNLKKAVSENLGLKEALAELEIKLRTNDFKTLK